MLEFNLDLTDIIKVQLTTVCILGASFLQHKSYQGFRLLLVIAGVGLSIELIQSMFSLYPNYPVATVFTLAYGPAYLLFIRGVLHSEQLRSNDILHFIPALSALVILHSPQFIIALGTVSQLIYGGLVLRSIARYHQNVGASSSDADGFRVNWIKYSVIVLVVSVVMDLVRLNMQPYIPSSLNQWLELANNACVLIVLSYLLRQFLSTIEIFTHDADCDESEEAPLDKELSTELANTLFEQLRNDIVERKLFLVPRLTLRNVSESVGISEKEVSWVINVGAKCNFNDFINRLRVAAFIDVYKSDQQARTSILGIALACGFNSKSSFNSVFKRETGMTPRQYLKRHFDA